MRYLIAAALVVFVGAPSSMEAQNTKGDCKDRCQTNYNFCLTRAVTKKAKSLCKTERKSCKKGCNALR
jgi:hypothetical protein